MTSPEQEIIPTFSLRRVFICVNTFYSTDRKRIIPLLSLSIAAGLFVVIVYNRAAEVNGLTNRFSLECFIDKPTIEQSEFEKRGPCEEEDVEHKFVSFCSCKADRRGLNQNVIAYSLYGNFADERHFTRYVDPFKIILSNITQAYPGWIIRIYVTLEHGDQVGSLKLKELFDDYPFVDLCNVTRVLEVRNITRPLFPMTWRFLPLMDPTVARMLPRDSDSLITVREVEAVREWLTESNATFHLMRDHWGHCSTDILGGFWGAKLYQNRQAILEASHKIYYETDHKMEYGFDQNMLNTYIWPLAKNDSLAHDSYCCQRFQGTKAFPTQRQGTEYVAKVVHQELVGHPIPDSCPEQCRPPDHPEWTNC